MSEGRGIVDLPPEHLVQFEQYVRFVSCAPLQNRQRFYLLSWQRLLHGELVLVCTWGRLGTLGRSRIIRFPDNLSIDASLQRVIKRRMQRGYQVTEWC